MKADLLQELTLLVQMLVQFFVMLPEAVAVKVEIILEVEKAELEETV